MSVPQVTQLLGTIPDDTPEGFVARHRLFLPLDILSRDGLWSGACVSVRRNDALTFCIVRPSLDGNACLSGSAAKVLGCGLVEYSRPLRVSALIPATALTLQPLNFPMPAVSFHFSGVSLADEVVCEGCVVTLDWFNQPTLFRVVDMQIGQSKLASFSHCSVVRSTTTIKFTSSENKPMISQQLDWASTVRSQISGYDQLVDELVDGIYNSLTAQHLQSHTYLLHGVPGCGKTSLALSLARSSGLPFFVVEGSQLFGAAQGSAEETLSSIFQRASKAAPSIIVFDDIDMICPQQESLVEARVLAHFLGLLDDFHHGSRGRNGVFVIATTCRLSAVDPALRGYRMRPVELEALTASGRLAVLTQCCKLFSWGARDKESVPQKSVLLRLSQQTQGFVGGDLQVTSSCINFVLSPS